jgi:hypothetical protein
MTGAQLRQYRRQHFNADHFTGGDRTEPVIPASPSSFMPEAARSAALEAEASVSA